MAEYQLAHDGFDERAYSGVLRGGKFIPCEANSKEWDDYMKWFAEGNRPDPWRSPVHGGQAISPDKDEVVVGSMFYSIKDYDPDLAGVPPAREPWNENLYRNQREQPGEPLKVPPEPGEAHPHQSAQAHQHQLYEQAVPHPRHSRAQEHEETRTHASSLSATGSGGAHTPKR
jgi:hypothetical protein